MNVQAIEDLLLTIDAPLPPGNNYLKYYEEVVRKAKEARPVLVEILTQNNKLKHP